VAAPPPGRPPGGGVPTRCCDGELPGDLRQPPRGKLLNSGASSPGTEMLGFFCDYLCRSFQNFLSIFLNFSPKFSEKFFFEFLYLMLLKIFVSIFSSSIFFQNFHFKLFSKISFSNSFINFCFKLFPKISFRTF
jgi:hypothetical protein